MYSAFITDDNDAHTFQIPAVLKGVPAGATVTWGASDPSAVACQVEAPSGGPFDHGAEAR